MNSEKPCAKCGERTGVVKLLKLHAGGRGSHEETWLCDDCAPHQDSDAKYLRRRIPKPGRTFADMLGNMQSHGLAESESWPTILNDSVEAISNTLDLLGRAASSGDLNEIGQIADRIKPFIRHPAVRIAMHDCAVMAGANKHRQAESTLCSLCGAWTKQQLRRYRPEEAAVKETQNWTVMFENWAE